MMNSNPETVSTDYDTSSRLYFEPLTIEDVLNVIDAERPDGIIVQFGGQTPLKLAAGLQAALRENPIPAASGARLLVCYCAAEAAWCRLFRLCSGSVGQWAEVHNCTAWWLLCSRQRALARWLCNAHAEATVCKLQPSLPELSPGAQVRAMWRSGARRRTASTTRRTATNGTSC